MEVGIVHAQQRSAFSVDDEPKIIAELRNEAARQGCDGVVIAGSHDSTGGESTFTGYRGACIMYTLEDTARAADETADTVSDDVAGSSEGSPPPVEETTSTESSNETETETTPSESSSKTETGGSSSRSLDSSRAYSSIVKRVMAMRRS